LPTDTEGLLNGWIGRSRVIRVKILNGSSLFSNQPGNIANVISQEWRPGAGRLGNINGSNPVETDRGSRGEHVLVPASGLGSLLSDTF
jgi:hypothetical protein